MKKFDFSLYLENCLILGCLFVGIYLFFGSELLTILRISIGSFLIAIPLTVFLQMMFSNERK
jgi:hypothetical protein